MRNFHVTSRGSRLAVGLTAAALAVCAPASLALAQQEVRTTMRVGRTVGGGHEGASSAISRRSLDRYIRILGLDDSQTDAAKQILAGYRAAHATAAQAHSRAMQDLLADSQDNDDAGEMLKKLPELDKKWQAEASRLEKGLMSDLKALLTEEQSAKWPKVERTRRREVGLSGTTVSGEGVDLASVVDTLRLDEKSQAAIDEAMEAYEAELDRSLAAKAEAAPKEDPTEGVGGAAGFDMEKIREASKKQHDAGAAVRDVNERHAAKIEGLLPVDKRVAFRDEVLRRSYPRVYRKSHAQRCVEAALKFEDLSPDQRREVEGLASAHERDAKAANSAWAKAIRESEGSGNKLVMNMGGSRVVMDTGEEDKALLEARKARKEIDDATREKLRKILTEAQKEKLPKPEARMAGPEKLYEDMGDSQEE